MKRDEAIKLIFDEIKAHPNKYSVISITKWLETEHDILLDREVIRKRIHRARLDNLIVPHRSLKKEEQMAKTKIPPEKRGGLETRGDNIVINWSSKTIITDLGEFGDYVCNFTTHGAIQRAYVHAYEGKGETASEVATRFDFAHSKAVYIYARLHGFTKSSIPQTDLEFEMGLTPEEASQETLQSLKRRAMKLTEKKKWREIQKDADLWNDLEHSILLTIKDWMDEVLPKYKPLELKIKPVVKDKFSAVIGVSDWHYMKLAFTHDGKETYNRKIALKKLQEAQSSLVSQMAQHGVPEVIYLPIGTDNLHIDNPDQTTTKGTPQAGKTDGDWRQALPEYVDIIINMVEMYSQIAPVEVISIPGNHDKHTSYVIAVMLRLFFEQNERVTVTTGLHPRVFKKYGRVCHVFDHGDDKSLNKFRANLHKSVLAEARGQGINLNGIDEWIFYSGHLHHENGFDAGGRVFHYVIPSLAETDLWEREGLYIGSKRQATIYLADPKRGRKAVLYSGS